jgi:hypothetical protein
MVRCAASVVDSESYGLPEPLCMVSDEVVHLQKKAGERDSRHG